MLTVVVVVVVVVFCFLFFILRRMGVVVVVVVVVLTLTRISSPWSQDRLQTLSGAEKYPYYSDPTPRSLHRAVSGTNNLSYLLSK